MKVKLVSDFIDYYDHWFDLDGNVFERMSRTNISKQIMFNRLTYMGFQVPNHFTVALFSEFELPGKMVVVYTDQYAHSGDGKEKLQLCEALVKYPKNYASAYIHKPYDDHRGHISRSYRYLRIGDKVFFLRYTSYTDSWRSNCGDVNITLWRPPLFLAGYIDREEYPMLAIDFVVSGDGLWAAIDFNTSPGLKHTPIETDVKGEQVVEWVKEWYRLKYKEA